MKRTLVVLAAVFMLGIGVSPSLAWEFSMTGESEWRYRYVSRTGVHDLFGNAEIAQHNPVAPGTGTSIGLAGPLSRTVVFPPPAGSEFQLGIALEGYSSKGADASYAETRNVINPVLTINRAVSLRAIIGFQGSLNGQYVGGPNWGTNPFYSGWIMTDSRDFVTGIGLAAPIVEAVWAKLQLPWCTLMVGQRPAGFGMGWAVHENDVYARSLSLVVPYGPLTLVFSQYAQDQLFSFTDPNDARNLNGTSYTNATSTDKNLSAGFSQAYAAVYSSAGLDTGIMIRLVKTPPLHAFSQPSNTFRDDVTGSRLQMPFLEAYRLGSDAIPIYGELFFVLGTTYAKYMRDRFFINGEYDFQVIAVRRNGGRPISGYAQAWAAEAGVFAGPAKLTLAHFYRSGDDRRGGILETRNATGSFLGTFVYDKFDRFVSWWGGGDTPIKPYEFLLGLYGTGNNSYTAAGKCTFEDFVAIAGRLDYAAAANLNFFGSVIKAWRASKTGTPIGMYDGVELPSTAGGGIALRGPTPNVDNTDLGWEVNVGLNWKLLEGVSYNFLFAYWQPGQWFNQAFRDLTYAGPINTVNPWLLPNGAVRPGRPIDALVAVQTGVLLQF
ncbi:MAG: hypothetical protein HY914_11220 [Desulfomonile tiedjei]|nr:hypothetical protein [Desulfomonile tiedjei]